MPLQECGVATDGRGNDLRTANQGLGSWVPSLERRASAPEGERVSSSPAQKDEMTARDVAGKYLDALAGTLRDDPDAFWLREAMLDAGRRLVGLLGSLRSGSADWLPLAGDDEGDRVAAFLGRFVQDIAGTGGLIADAAIREAAAACGEEILDAPGPVQDAVKEGKAVTGSVISGELFCLVFRLFFKDAITSFITTIIAGKMKLAVPLLHVIDPAGKIADWVGEQVVARIPDPCAEGSTLGEKPSLADLAQSLVTESVDRALGITPADPATVAA
jgi:hypothetical protein